MSAQWIMKNLFFTLGHHLLSSGVGVVAITSGILLLPQVVLGRVITPVSPITGVDDFVDILCYITDVIFTISIVIAIIFGIVAGYRYMTSGGETEKVSSAHKTLTYAAVGVAVAIIAVGVPTLVWTILAEGTSGGFASPCG